MNLPVFYTPRAKETLESSYNFIANQFGGSSADKFLATTDRIVLLIANQPFMYKRSSIDENVRVAFITRQTSLFYRVNSDSIHLLFFWDNRQRPMLERF
jgi:plasmid stabilization system protein ParE